MLSISRRRGFSVDLFPEHPCLAFPRTGTTGWGNPSFLRVLALAFPFLPRHSIETRSCKRSTGSKRRASCIDPCQLYPIAALNQPPSTHLYQHFTRCAAMELPCSRRWSRLRIPATAHDVRPRLDLSRVDKLLSWGNFRYQCIELLES